MYYYQCLKEFFSEKVFGSKIYFSRKIICLLINWLLRRGYPVATPFEISNRSSNVVDFQKNIRSRYKIGFYTYFCWKSFGGGWTPSELGNIKKSIINKHSAKISCNYKAGRAHKACKKDKFLGFSENDENGDSGHINFYK